MSASALASVNPTHNKTPARTAPMTLTRPLAFRSCCPGQRCPRGAYPWVRAMSWAKPLPSIWTMGRASRSWASLLSRNPCCTSWSAFGCVRAFFICHARFAKRLPYGLRCHIKPRSALLSAGVGMVSHLLRKLLRVDLSDLPTLVGPGINPPGPTPDRGNSNREPLRGFSSAQAFLLPYRKNMPTKWYRICHDKQYHINVAKLYVDILGFDLIEDTDLGRGKSWVRVRPGNSGSALLLQSRQTSASGRASATRPAAVSAFSCSRKTLRPSTHAWSTPAFASWKIHATRLTERLPFSPIRSAKNGTCCSWRDRLPVHPDASDDSNLWAARLDVSATASLAPSGLSEAALK